IFVADMLGRGPRRKTEIPTHTPLPKLIGRIDDRPQWQRNTLFKNRGDGSFAEIAAFAGIEASDWSWDAQFLDVDLDGYEDLLITTGHLWDVMDADTWERARTMFSGLEWRRELAQFPKLAVPSVAFRNNGDLTFPDVGQRRGFGSDPFYSFAAGNAQELTIEVAWRRGGRSIVHGVKPNREYEIMEPAQSPGVPGSPGLRPGSAPWFRDASAEVSHRHVDTPYNDW